jgi:hypothetical protein
MAEAKLRIPERIAPGDYIVVHSTVAHPVAGSHLRERQGDAACFIREAVVTYDGREVARFEWPAVGARDAVVSFRLKADREAPITMTWRDDRGAVFEKSVDVTFR